MPWFRKDKGVRRKSLGKELYRCKPGEHVYIDDENVVWIVMIE